MKKRLLCLSCLLLISAGSLVACGEGSKSDLTLNNGILTWDSTDKNATYVVDLGYEEITVEGNEVDLTGAITEEGQYNISVSKADGDKEIGEINIDAVKCDKADISVVEKKGEPYFEWTISDKAAGCQYNLYDGKGFCQVEAKDGKYTVAIGDAYQKLISVKVDGGSEGNTLLLDSDTSFKYESNEIFNFAELAKYPFVFTSKGDAIETFKAGTTLEKGVYELEVKYFAMNSNGQKLSGNGAWGRRMVDNREEIWICATDLDNGKKWDSGDTIPMPNKAVTRNMLLNVDKDGNAIFGMYDFKTNEMIVIGDIIYNGKSVMSKEVKESAKEEIEPLDVNNLDKYIAIHRGNGRYVTEGPITDHQIDIPINLPDGEHKVEVTFNVCASDGSMISGNGIWGRRLMDTTQSKMKWLNEYTIDTFEGIDLPKPTEDVTAKYTVQVKNGKFSLLCADFNEGEMVLVKKAAEAQEAVAGDTFVSEGPGWVAEWFRVQTTLKKRAQIEIEVTYKVSKEDGSNLTGNGLWGRRIVDELANHWLCTDLVDKKFPESKGTLPTANKTITEKLQVTTTKFGVFKLEMRDFLEGEMVKIVEIKYKGKSILAK